MTLGISTIDSLATKNPCVKKPRMIFGSSMGRGNKSTLSISRGLLDKMQESKKDFDKWNMEKKRVDDAHRIFFHEREIWWAKLGVNIGFEQDGKGRDFARPILIVKKFNNIVFWGLPLTTKVKKSKFYFELNSDDGVQRSAILSQLKLYDAKRLMGKMSYVREDNYKEIKKAITRLLEE
jgi:mRNA interferase MazF